MTSTITDHKDTPTTPAKPQAEKQAKKQAMDEVLGSQNVNAIKRIIRMALRYRLRFTIGAVCTVIAANFQIMIPQYLGTAVDQAHNLMAATGANPEDTKAALATAALFLLGAGILRGIFTMTHTYQGEAIGQSIGYELRLAYFEKLQRLSYSYHDRVHSGDLMTRGMLDIEGMRRFVDAAMLRTIVLVILVSYGGYHLMSTDMTLGLFALSFVPVVAWRAAVSRIWLRRTWRSLQEKLSVLTRLMEENLGGIRVVRAFAAEDHELRKFDAASDEAVAMTMQRIKIRYANSAVMSFAFYAAMGLVLWVGGHKILAGDITIGKLAEFLAFMAILQQPVRQLGMIVNVAARASICAARVFTILDIPPAVTNKPNAKSLSLSKKVLRFEHVDFAYEVEAGTTPALHDVSFEISPGKTIGIVGPPGSGKSTIAHLIPRFYDVTAGRITIDGQDIRDVTLESLRETVGTVQQDAFLFTASVGNNVAYGEPGAPRDRIEKAADSAQLHDYIACLPMAYGTLIGERGLTLSGGQRQRLSIARSIMLSPDIIVFDDSTAAVDAGTEQSIRAALKARTKNQATIIISHRLSSLMHADEILFFEEGHIVERGSHEALLHEGGRYKDLYDIQVEHGHDVTDTEQKR